jgi:hypothetical protein
VLPFIFLRITCSVGGAKASLNSKAKIIGLKSIEKKLRFEQIFQPNSAPGVEYFFERERARQGPPTIQSGRERS